MRIFPLATPYTFAVTWRQYIVWRKLIWSALATNIANPLLMLFAFGFGFGRLIDRLDGVSYMAFVVPGMIAYSAVFSASFETTIGSFSRYHMQKNWDATLSTPVTLSELLFGEVLWAALKAMISAVAVLIVGALWGGIPSLIGALFALPVLFVASIGFACYGLVATSFAKGYDFFSYFFTFWITPMFVFSGVFFPLEQLPVYVRAISWMLPMTHLVEIVRSLSIGQPITLAAFAMHMGYMLILSAAAFWLAFRNMRRRMFD